MPAPALVLASSSPYRRALLARLGVEFVAVAPAADETPAPGEAPDRLAARLAEAKARALAARFPGRLILGSDQTACLDGELLGKPGGADANVAQLERAAGRRVAFYTAVCLLVEGTARVHRHLDAAAVVFRPLTGAQIRAYVAAERPFDCAGGFKHEALGVALFERYEGADPTGLEGLPLMALTRMLAAEGLDVLLAARPRGDPTSGSGAPMVTEREQADGRAPIPSGAADEHGSESGGSESGGSGSGPRVDTDAHGCTRMNADERG